MNWISDALGQAMIGLWFAPSSRTFVPFLITSFAIAGIASWLVGRTKLRPDQRLFSRETWLSRSAINDYGLIFLNALLLAALFTIIMPDDLANTNTLITAVRALSNATPAIAAWWVPLALAACLFVVDDLIRYVSHYCEHRIPLLWEFHKVHHSAQVLNFMTAERHHPVSIFVFQIIRGAGLILINAGFIVWFGDQISPLGWLGGNVFWVVTNLIGGALRHSPVWISFGPHVENWLISPAQHQVHHSDDPRHFDCNFGGTLALWDRLFGTLYITTPKREDIRYGLGSETAEYDSLASLYMRPMRGAIRRFNIKDGTPS